MRNKPAMAQEAHDLTCAGITTCECSLTTQAQRPGPRDAERASAHPYCCSVFPIATATARRRSLAAHGQVAFSSLSPTPIILVKVKSGKLDQDLASAKCLRAGRVAGAQV